MNQSQEIFEDLFVLELANNHWGSMERGERIIRDFAKVARFNNVKAAIKLQFRDVEHFVHKDFRNREDIRYIKKTIDTRMTREQYSKLIDLIRSFSLIPMATPFDEASVQLCEDLNLPIIKIASSDLNDWVLIERIAKTKKPVICSTGGASLKDMDDRVQFFARRNIPLALNHCVSMYPSEDQDLELNQIDFLKKRYPNVTIGWSTHEYQDWSSSIMIAYAKGARTFERHIDLDLGDHPFTPYCSKPENIDQWFKAWKKAKEMSGGSGTQKRNPPEKEIKYLDALVRGVYAKRDLKAGESVTLEDIYLAVPLQKGQLSCREMFLGEALVMDVSADQAIHIDCFDNPYSKVPEMKAFILGRGL